MINSLIFFIYIFIFILREIIHAQINHRIEVSKVFASKRVEPPYITYQGCLSHVFSFSTIDLHGRLNKRKRKITMQGQSQHIWVQESRIILRQN